jgi:O-antigen ligase
VSLAANYLLFIAALPAGATPQRTMAELLRWPCVRVVLLFLLLTGASLGWTVAASLPAAVAFWLAMAADTGTVLLLLRKAEVDDVADSVMRGFITGACAMAVIAWLMPAQSDLRLGDEELLGPNQIGWACAFALLLAQYLVRVRSERWRFAMVLLTLTLARSLSKTSIVAMVAGEGYILLRDRRMSGKVKLLVVGAAVCLVAVFWGLYAQYYDVYRTGDQAETLTGRLGIWAYMMNEAMDAPWLGHGFHSVWKVIPPFGVFEARHAHNELLQQFYAYGLAGVLMLALLYGSVLRQLLRLRHDGPRILLQGMLLVVIVRGFADTEAFDLSLPSWFIVLLGALFAQAALRNGAPS